MLLQELVTWYISPQEHRSPQLLKQHVSSSLYHAAIPRAVKAYGFFDLDIFLSWLVTLSLAQVVGNVPSVAWRRLQWFRPNFVLPLTRAQANLWELRAFLLSASPQATHIFPPSDDTNMQLFQCRLLLFTESFNGRNQTLYLEYLVGYSYKLWFRAILYFLLMLCA